MIIMLLSRIAKWNETNVGKFLIDFLYYFGYYYDYQYEMNTTAAIMQNRGLPIDYKDQLDSIHPYVMTLHIYDPLNNSNNVGTEFLIQANTSKPNSFKGCLEQPTSPSTSISQTSEGWILCSKQRKYSREQIRVLILKDVCVIGDI